MVFEAGPHRPCRSRRSRGRLSGPTPSRRSREHRRAFVRTSASTAVPRGEPPSASHTCRGGAAHSRNTPPVMVSEVCGLRRHPLSSVCPVVSDLTVPLAADPVTEATEVAIGIPVARLAGGVEYACRRSGRIPGVPIQGMRRALLPRQRVTFGDEASQSSVRRRIHSTPPRLYPRHPRPPHRPPRPLAWPPVHPQPPQQPHPQHRRRSMHPPPTGSSMSLRAHSTHSFPTSATRARTPSAPYSSATTPPHSASCTATRSACSRGTVSNTHAVPTRDTANKSMYSPPKSMASGTR